MGRKIRDEKRFSERFEKLHKILKHFDVEKIPTKSGRHNKAKFKDKELADIFTSIPASDRSEFFEYAAKAFKKQARLERQIESDKKIVSEFYKKNEDFLWDCEFRDLALKGFPKMALQGFPEDQHIPHIVKYQHERGQQCAEGRALARRLRILNEIAMQ